MGFVHLHVHSQLSLLDGTMDPGKLGGVAQALGMDAIALTDTSNLFGGVTFYKGCKAAGVKAILGAELHVQPEGVDHHPEPPRGTWQIVALVEDQVGYRNLCALITAAIFDGTWYRPRVDLQQLAAHREGLLFLTGGPKGVVGRPILAAEDGAARDALVSLRDAVGGERLFLELQDVGLEGQERINDGVRALSAELGVPTVVTNPVHYQDAEDAAVHEVLNCIAEGASVGAEEGRTDCPTDQAYLKTEAELRALFPEDGAAIDRTVEIAARCDFHYDFDTYHFPATTPPDVDADGTQPDTDANWAYFFQAFPPPRDFGTGPGVPPRPEGAGNLDGYFRWYSTRGLELRLERIDTAQHAVYW
jgi:DNA polymerase-3 subunit alpha